MYEQLWKESINIKDFQSSLLWSRLCLGGANLIPKQVEHLRKEEKEKKKRKNRKCWGWVYFFCLCTGSPGDGGTCSQEFPGPGESHVPFFFFFFFAVAFYRYMKHLQIQQNQTYRSSWIRSCSSDDFLIFSFFLLLHIMIHWNKRHSCWILCIHWPARTTTVPPGTNDLIDSARNPWRTFHLAAHRVLIDWCLFCQSEVASICH